jgi:2-polyprenyl-3-methyl-5-hydroxy-6-metoxy-1,4-benzoquinol methylase
MDLKEEEILGDKIHTHWYYISKGRALRRLIGHLNTSEILDVGAGSGIFSKQMLDAKFCQSAICVDPGYSADTSGLYNGSPLAFVRHADNVPQNLILMMDVLEHVDDDVALLKSYSDRMPRGGHVVITVPAFQFLWSGHDVFLEHRRRYTAASIERTVRAAGLEVVRTNYFFGLLFPVVAAIRLFRKRLLDKGGIKAQSELKPAGPLMNRLLIAVHDLERATVFPFNKAAGLSVFCLCRKP